MNDELADRFEARATRGTERGADAVYDAARLGDYAPVDTPRARRHAPLLVAAGVLAIGAIGAGTLVIANDAGDGEAERTTDYGLPGECHVFVRPEQPDRRVFEIAAIVADDAAVESSFALTQEQAYEEFAVLFAHKPELLDSVTADVLPPSVRVQLHAHTRPEVEAFVDRYSDLEGVREAQCDAPAMMGVPPANEDCAVAPGAGASDDEIEQLRSRVAADQRVSSVTVVPADETYAAYLRAMAEYAGGVVPFTAADASVRISAVLTERSDAEKEAFAARWLADPGVADVVCSKP
jgi:hypothetical protein